jgi:DNA repair protein RadC
VHNHPSANITPSAEDKRITVELAEAARLLGIRMLDHIIIGDGRYFSFADEGMIP